MIAMQSSSEPLTVLIAEDSAADRLLLSTIVRRQGHHVLTAADGAEAVDVYLEQRPHLVLMDAMMPVMDGFEAAQKNQTVGRGPVGPDHFPNLAD